MQLTPHLLPPSATLASTLKPTTPDLLPDSTPRSLRNLGIPSPVCAWRTNKASYLRHICHDPTRRSLAPPSPTDPRRYHVSHLRHESTNFHLLPGRPRPSLDQMRPLFGAVLFIILIAYSIKSTRSISRADITQPDCSPHLPSHPNHSHNACPPKPKISPPPTLL